jgi:hypothetical protein
MFVDLDLRQPDDVPVIGFQRPSEVRNDTRQPVPDVAESGADCRHVVALEALRHDLSANAATSDLNRHALS